MDYAHILVKTSLSFTELAKKIKELINVADTNRKSYHKEQTRYGLNIGGGDYYLFESFGLELYIIRNKGDVAVSDESFPYYLTIKCPENIDSALFSNLVTYIELILNKEGFVTQTHSD